MYNNSNITIEEFTSNRQSSTQCPYYNVSKEAHRIVENRLHKGYKTIVNGTPPGYGMTFFTISHLLARNAILREAIVDYPAIVDCKILHTVFASIINSPAVIRLFDDYFTLWGCKALSSLNVDNILVSSPDMTRAEAIGHGSSVSLYNTIPKRRSVNKPLIRNKSLFVVCIVHADMVHIKYPHTDTILTKDTPDSSSFDIAYTVCSSSEHKYNVELPSWIEKVTSTQKGYMATLLPDSIYRYRSCVYNILSIPMEQVYDQFRDRTIPFVRCSHLSNSRYTATSVDIDNRVSLPYLKLGFI